MAKVKPLADKVFIQPLKEEEKTKSGIYLPDSAKEKPKYAKVLAVGEGKYVDGKLVPLTVKVGDKILTKEWGGDEIKIDGEEYKIVSEDDILAIVE
jgi:chaperonin GroES